MPQTPEYACDDGRRCFLCGSGRIVDETADYQKCGECLTISVRVPPPPHETLAESNVYERAPDYRDRRVFERMKALAGSRGSLLDLGCGNGAFLRLALDHGWTGVGVDGSPELAASAVAAGTPVELCDLDQWKPRRMETHDAVRLWYTLEHVAQPGRLVKMALESLKPGGLLLVGIPNDATTLCRRLMTSSDDRFWEKRLHLHHYPPFGLERFMESRGMTTVAADVTLPSELLRNGAIPFEEAIKHIGELEKAWEKSRDLIPEMAAIFYKLGIGRTREIFFRKNA